MTRASSTSSRRQARILWSIATVLFVMCDVGRHDLAQSLSESAVPVAVEVPFRPEPVRAEGQSHLFYELHLTNFRRVPLELTRLEVHAGSADGPLLVSYAQQELSDRIVRPGSPGDLLNGRVIDAGLRAVVMLHLSIDARRTVANVLWHRLTFESIQANGGVTENAIDGGRVDIAKDRPVTIDPPLRGGRWLAANGPANDSEHRRALIVVNGRARIAQRFAIDWVKFGSDGQLAHDDRSRNTNWYGYGSDVLAVAEGRVVAVRDGIPENVPLTDTFAVPITLETIAGNYVILDISGGRYATFAHLQPNSIRVSVGSHVRRGQVVGLLGNSGNSDAPHLHFQVTDADSPLGSEGLPFLLKTFRFDGRITSLESLLRGDAWRGPNATAERLREMPMDNAVIQFP